MRNDNPEPNGNSAPGSRRPTATMLTSRGASCWSGWTSVLHPVGAKLTKTLLSRADITDAAAIGLPDESADVVIDKAMLAKQGNYAVHQIGRAAPPRCRQVVSRRTSRVVSVQVPPRTRAPSTRGWAVTSTA
jgi:hypothetical protein